MQGFSAGLGGTGVLQKYLSRDTILGISKGNREGHLSLTTSKGSNWYSIACSHGFNRSSSDMEERLYAPM